MLRRRHHRLQPAAPRGQGEAAGTDAGEVDLGPWRILPTPLGTDWRVDGSGSKKQVNLGREKLLSHLRLRDMQSSKLSARCPQIFSAVSASGSQEPLSGLCSGITVAGERITRLRLTEPLEQFSALPKILGRRHRQAWRQDDVKKPREKRATYKPRREALNGSCPHSPQKEPALSTS